MQVLKRGEATTLVMSFALMTCLSLIANRLTEGKSIAVGDAVLGNALITALVGWATVIVIWRLSLTPEVQARIKLSRDNDPLLTTFGISGRKVRLLTLIGSCVLLSAGTFLYIAQQDYFAASNYSSYIIPVFAVAISQSSPNVWRISLVSLLLTGIERYLRIWGEPTLIRAYQGGILVALIIIAPLLTTAWYHLKPRSAFGHRQLLAPPKLKT